MDIIAEHATAQAKVFASAIKAHENGLIKAAGLIKAIHYDGEDMPEVSPATFFKDELTERGKSVFGLDGPGVDNEALGKAVESLSKMIEEDSERRKRIKKALEEALDRDED